MRDQVRRFSNLASVEREDWDAVVERSPDSSVFQLYGWCSAWLRSHRAQYAETLIFGAFRKEVLVGIAPLVVRKESARGDRFGSLGFIGAPHADYLTFPCVDDSVDLISLLLNAVESEVPAGVLIELEEVPQFSSLALCLRERASVRGTEVFLQSTTSCPYMRIRENLKYAKERHEKESIRRHERLLRKAGIFEVQHLREPDAILRNLDELFGLHIERWRGTSSPSLFLNTANIDFFRLLVQSDGFRGQVLYSRCVLEGRCIAAHLGLVFRNQLIWYKPAFDPAFRLYSPGEVLLGHLIRYAIDCGFGALDFSRGREAFKFRFNSDVAYNATFVIARTGSAKWKNERRRIVRRLRGRIFRPGTEFGGGQSGIGQALRKSRVLVLDGHSSAAVECTQAMGRQGVEVEVASASKTGGALDSKYARMWWPQPEASSRDSFNEWLRERVAGADYAMIVPTTENTLAAINALGDSDKLRVLCAIPSAAAVETFLDKRRTWQLATSLGLRVPREVGLRGPGTRGVVRDYPMVIKPMRSMEWICGELRRVSPAIVSNDDEYEAALSGMPVNGEIQGQEYIVGDGVGVECLYSHGRMCWGFVHERIHELPLTGGGSTYRRSIRMNAQAIRSAKMLLDAVNWHGVAMVEFKRMRNGEFCLMEVNPRFWGSLALAVDAGVNFPVGLLAQQLKGDCGPQPDYRIGYFTRHLARDADWFKENLRADHRNPLLLTRGRLGSLLEWGRSLMLRESWDHFDWGDLRPIESQIRFLFRSNLSGLRKRVNQACTRRSMRIRHAKTMNELSAGRRVRTLLFVCYGNICRSAFAERYARASGFMPEVDSAGFHPASGRPSPVHLSLAASLLGVDMNTWMSKTLNGDMVSKADLIVLMDEENFESFNRSFPDAMGRVVMLALCSAGSLPGIRDPYTLDMKQTLDVLRGIKSHVDALRAILDRSGH